MAAARREVLEETGHRVTIHEFLGTLAYEASGRPKVVQFWRMRALGEPIGDLMRDVKAVHWLALEDAVEQLTHLRERVFLEQVGPIALKLAERSVRRPVHRGRPAGNNFFRPRPPGASLHAIGTDVPLAPVADGNPAIEHVATVEHVPPQHDVGQRSGLVPAANVLGRTRPSGQIGQDQDAEAGVGRGLIQKTWGWLRHTAMPHRQPLD
jgi:8-oxo-dGTP diphosphatase